MLFNNILSSSKVGCVALCFVCPVSPLRMNLVWTIDCRYEPNTPQNAAHLLFLWQHHHSVASRRYCPTAKLERGRHLKNRNILKLTLPSNRLYKTEPEMWGKMLVVWTTAAESEEAKLTAAPNVEVMEASTSSVTDRFLFWKQGWVIVSWQFSSQNLEPPSFLVWKPSSTNQELAIFVVCVFVFEDIWHPCIRSKGNVPAFFQLRFGKAVNLKSYILIPSVESSSNNSCSQRGLWIIQSSRALKTDAAVQLLKCHFTKLSSI